MLIGLPLCLAGNFIIPITVRPCMDLLWVSSKWHRWKRAIVAELGEATPEWPGSADQSAQATWMKGNQCSKRISFFFFFFWSQNNFGNLNFHQCKCVSLLCSEANWYHVTPLPCYSAASLLILPPPPPPPQERSQRTDSSASSCATDRAGELD